MKPPSRWSRVSRYAPAAGLLFTGSCLANLEQNLDLLLAPGAASNTLALPYSSIASLAEVFIRLYFG